MTEGSIVQIVALVGWLVLVGSALASYRLEWKSALRMALVWGAIFASVFLFVSVVM